MPPEDRARLLGIVVNRFRGDASLFEDGIRFLEERTGLPVLALLPCLEHGLDEEDRPFRIPVDQGAPAGRLKGSPRTLTPPTSSLVVARWLGVPVT